jgi:tetratricopeptide (TPR) repeat protein
VEDAAGVLKTAVKKDPKNVQYLVMLGDLYLSKGEISIAREVFEQAMQLAPNDLNLLINVGSRYEKNGLDKGAEAIYLTLSKLYPENILVVNHLAWFYTDKKGDLEKAKPFIDTLRVKGEGAFEKDTIGWYFYKTGDYGSAETYFREALRMDPDNNVIRGHLALTLFQTGKNRDGLIEAGKVVPVLPRGNLKEILLSKMASAEKGDSKR